MRTANRRAGQLRTEPRSLPIRTGAVVGHGAGVYAHLGLPVIWRGGARARQGLCGVVRIQVQAAFGRRQVGAAAEGQKGQRGPAVGQAAAAATRAAAERSGWRQGRPRTPALLPVGHATAAAAQERCAAAAG